MTPFKKRTKNFTILPTELNNLPALSNGAFRLYALACGWDDFHFSYTKIHKQTGMSRNTISKAIKELVSYNMIEYKKGCGFNGMNKQSNKYNLLDSSNWLGIETRLSLVSKLDQALVQKRDSIKHNIKHTPKVEYINDTSAIIDVEDKTRIGKKDIVEYERDEKANVVTKDLECYNEEGELRIVSEHAVKEIAKLAKDKKLTGLETARKLKGRLPDQFYPLFVSSYLSGSPITAAEADVLESMSRILGNRDSCIKVLARYVEKFGLEAEESI